MNITATILTVARKELLDLFRDRRTVMLALLLSPILFPALIIGMGRLAESKAKTQLEEAMQLPVVGAQHAPNLIAHLKSQNIVAVPAPKDIDAAIRAQTHDVALRISPEFPEQWRGCRATSMSASSRLGWLATMMSPGSSRRLSSTWASRRSMPLAAATRQKKR